MGEELSTHVRLEAGMHFVAVANSNQPVQLDSPTSGEMAGAAPMELVLMALAGCSGMDVISILRKKRQQVHGFEVKAHGVRSDEYPKVYTAIQLEFICTGVDIDPAAVERAIELARDRYCPVWAMLRATVDISYSYTINSPA